MREDHAVNDRRGAQGRFASCLPVSSSHKRIVPSLLHDNAFRPSGEKTISPTPAVWPRNRRTGRRPRRKSSEKPGLRLSTCFRSASASSWLSLFLQKQFESMVCFPVPGLETEDVALSGYRVDRLALLLQRQCEVKESSMSSGVIRLDFQGLVVFAPRLGVFVVTRQKVPIVAVVLGQPGHSSRACRSGPDQPLLFELPGPARGA